jgi:hypothetical protein
LNVKKILHFNFFSVNLKDFETRGSSNICRCANKTCLKIPIRLFINNPKLQYYHLRLGKKWIKIFGVGTWFWDFKFNVEMTPFLDWWAEGKVRSPFCRPDRKIFDSFGKEILAVLKRQFWQEKVPKCEPQKFSQNRKIAKTGCENSKVN